MTCEYHSEILLDKIMRNVADQVKIDCRKKNLPIYGKEFNKKFAVELISFFKNGENEFSKFKDLNFRINLLAQIQNLDNDNLNPFDKNRQYFIDNARDCYSQLFVEKAKVFSDYYSNISKKTKSFEIFTPKFSIDNLELLPAGTIFIWFKIFLASPYLSKDDDPFYFHDNPIRKEWIFKLPMVSASSWKGAFRSALGRELLEDQKSDQKILNLLGQPRESEEDQNRGRLRFYPSFFQNIDLEIINPHDRKTSTGSGLINIECVPADAKSEFALLYVPFNLSEDKFGQVEEKEVLEDVPLIGKALYRMMIQQGFGAKTSSGMGRIKNKIGELEISVNVPEGSANFKNHYFRENWEMEKFKNLLGNLQKENGE